MGDLDYAEFSLLQGRLVIEDVAYDSCPDSWQRATGEDGLRGDTVRTGTLTRKNVVQPARNGIAWNGYVSEALTGSATDAHSDTRHVLSQVWSVGWGDAFMSWCVRDHLMTLYTLQKGFWLQYDDEMSRDCAALKPYGTDGKTFLAPTYPLAFYRVGDVDGQFSQDHVYFELRIDNIVVDWATNPYRVDHDTGTVVFENSISEESIVTLKYLWRAYVRVKEIELSQLAMAQHLYTGTVVFEQLRPPVAVERFDDRLSNEPCRNCEDGDKRVEDTGEECFDPTGPSAARQESVGEPDTWLGLGNTEQVDGQSASVGVAFASVTNKLHLYEYNLNTPDDQTKRMSRFQGTVYQSSNAPANTRLIELRLTYYDVPIGPNLADGVYGLQEQYAFEVDLEDLGGYEPTWDDLHDGRIGVVLQYETDDNAVDIAVDSVQLGVCWDDWTEPMPEPGDCGCEEQDPIAGTVSNTSLSCTHRDDSVDVDGFDVPLDHYVHGVEVSSLVAGAEKGCAQPPTHVAEVALRLKLNAVGSSFSSLFTKSDQPVGIVDHAYLNPLDATSDLSWGGRNDCFGFPVGGWTPALVNTNGFRVETSWDTLCQPDALANWSYAKSWDGSAVGVGIDGSCDADFDDAWGGSGQNTDRSMCCDGSTQGYLSCQQSGTITHEFTWIGAGDAPPFLMVRVYSLARAGNGTFEASAPHTQTGDNGLGDPFVLDPSQEFGESVGTHVLQVPVVDGVATLTVSLSAYAQQGPPLVPGNSPCSTATVDSTAVIDVSDTCVYPELQWLSLKVHHSPVCDLDSKCFHEATVTGWGTVHKGLSCGLASSSDGALNGAFSLLGDGFNLASIGANSRIVGILVTGEYRVSPSYVRAGNLTVKAHVGTYDSGRTGKTLAYPQTNEWASFSLGGDGDFWDYGAVFAATGVTYPTATGAQLNSLFQLELLGDNDAGYTYEFRNLKAKVFYFDVGDGL